MLLLFSSLSTPLDNILNKWFFLYVALTHYCLHCVLLISHLRLSLSLNQLCMYCIIALLCFISNSLNRHFLINLQVVIPFCSDINFAESRSSEIFRDFCRLYQQQFTYVLEFVYPPFNFHLIISLLYRRGSHASRFRAGSFTPSSLNVSISFGVSFVWSSFVHLYSPTAISIVLISDLTLSYLLICF